MTELIIGDVFALILGQNSSGQMKFLLHQFDPNRNAEMKYPMLMFEKNVQRVRKSYGHL